ncbi:MAG TPA: hypothetical protein VKB87_04510 [Myxococcaceae bacterium]|nr:hypothetical protein [Myxococcaceae bacterium]
MEFTHLYNTASGPAITDCCFIGQRYEKTKPFSPYASESWVLRNYLDPKSKQLICRLTYGVAGYFTMLWRAPSGTVYVAEADNRVHISSRPEEFKSWRQTEVPAFLRGIWGLDDSCVFAWGVRDRVQRLLRWNGSTWTELSAPGEIVRMHGTSPDFMFAVGAKGLLARWNGQNWQQVPIRTNETLTGVFIAGPNEYYACGEGGTLLSGTAHGWRERATAPGPLHDVAVFAGSVWVAAGDAGLMRLKGTSNELEAVKPNVKALCFDVRGQLLITCSEELVGSSDGVSFGGCCEGALERYTANRKPLWQQ